MPEQARVLKFRPRLGVASKSREEALGQAQDYLVKAAEEGFTPERVCDDPDVLMAICALLREKVNTCPTDVLEPAAKIFGWLSQSSQGPWFFDERDFFLGESALIAGCAARLLGDRADAELWLDRADASYRHTINPTPNLARVGYIRLTLRFDMHRHREVLELLPSLSLTFEKLGMYTELAKCWLLEAMSFKAQGLSNEAARGFERIISETRSDDAIRGMAMLNLGNLRSLDGRYDEALSAYRSALPVVSASQSATALADLKGMVGETLQKMGQLGAAVAAFRESVNEYVQLGMQTRVAYLRVVLADALLESGSPREAEWELLTALPTLEEQGMVPEGFAAVGLLRESVRQRKTDPAALSELRDYLQAKN